MRSRRVSAFCGFSLTDTTRTLPEAARSVAPSRWQLLVAAWAVGARTAARASVSTAIGRIMRLIVIVARGGLPHPEVVSASTFGSIVHGTMISMTITTEPLPVEGDEQRLHELGYE